MISFAVVDGALYSLHLGTHMIRTPIVCPHCTGPRVRNDRWDAYYCPRCLVWLEKQCGDPGCHMCVGRPEKPPTEEEKKA